MYHEEVNIGIAVALPDGLLVPVLKDANKKGAAELIAEYGALISKAQAGKLSFRRNERGHFHNLKLRHGGHRCLYPDYKHA